MTQEFKLRIGSFSDFDGLFPIYMHEKVNPYLNFEIMNAELFLPLFHELLQNGQLYVYEGENKILATCIVMKQKRRAQHVASLGTLATHPHYQGQGIGTNFIKDLVITLKTQGIKRIDLCAEADNLVALNFYKKIGFQLEGILKSYFKRSQEDHYIDEYMMAFLIE